MAYNKGLNLVTGTGRQTIDALKNKVVKTSSLVGDFSNTEIVKYTKTDNTLEFSLNRILNGAFRVSVRYDYGTGTSLNEGGGLLELGYTGGGYDCTGENRETHTFYGVVMPGMAFMSKEESETAELAYNNGVDGILAISGGGSYTGDGTVTITITIEY